ncbi:hypothetical protein [Sulfurimonas sp.]|jgi:hypothetical protein|uniref:hypothetical protein n=1 Tax=Sulfurimonas sp. TaxID=2022749 RepID=UPI0025E5A56F|nr:hypothetical protein [Sulfurimonas sp.]MBT5934407.1 hypothetical protein [Sulfurimonas sp.]
MTATLHASERLLQRAFKMSEYTFQDIQRAAKLLEKEFSSIHTSCIHTKISLPSFPTMVAVVREGMIVTIKSKLKSPGMDEKKRKRLFLRNKYSN